MNSATTEADIRRKLRAIAKQKISRAEVASVEQQGSGSRNRFTEGVL